MKISAIQILSLSFAILLSPCASATPGGLDVGTKFTLTVVEKSSIKISQFSTSTNAAVFAGAPNFAKGQKVVFKIGSKGQITAKGMSIPIVRADSLSNLYMKKRRENGTLFLSNGQLVKKKKVPKMLVLSFNKTSGQGFQTKAHTVSYTLE